jgi:hypothetical protein
MPDVLLLKFYEPLKQPWLAAFVALTGRRAMTTLLDYISIRGDFNA